MISPAMDGFSGVAHSAGGRFVALLPSSTSRNQKKKSGWCSPGRRTRFFPVCLANRDGSSGSPELDKWDQMELKFGRYLGEDPKLTLAKIMGRKLNPDASFLEIEKSFYKNKGKLDYGEAIKEDTDTEKSLRPPPRMPASARSSPVRDSNALNLQRPAMDRRMKAARASEKPVPASMPQSSKPPERTADKDAATKVALRKPAHLQGDDITLEKPSKFRIKPNLSLKMKPSSESTADVTLLKKPEIVKTSNVDPIADDVDSEGEFLLRSQETDQLSTVGDGDADLELHPESDDAEIGVDLEVKNESSPPSVGLIGKPQRLDSPSSDMTSSNLGESKVGTTNFVEPDLNIVESVPSADQEAREAPDWRRAEELIKTGERTEVELISCSSRGFVVSFGSLIGFLPYRNLGAKWKFLAFESWLRKKGLDPSLYRQKLSIMGNYEVQKKNFVDSTDNQIEGYKDTDKLDPDMKFEELLDIYDREKNRFLSSFIGQVIRVSVVLADKKSRKLICSGRPKEKEEMLEKKRSLMAKLSIGDVVKCCVKKITYFGIFVEIEDVPALIHQSEISWDETLDPSSFFQIGQIVDAKVHQLDYALERITLTLKEITPDPLNEALESVVGDYASLSGAVETAQDAEWTDVESLIEELEKIDGVVGVSKGRFFLSPGLTPTFQVYMASMYENQYKLLARNGNKVQEVLVQTSMDKEQMKAAILTCTSRVQ